jgi:hypothetical protein
LSNKVKKGKSFLDNNFAIKTKSMNGNKLYISCYLDKRREEKDGEARRQGLYE